MYRTFTPSYSILPENKIRQDIKSTLIAAINGKAPGFFVTENGISGFGIGSNAPGKISIRGINGIQQTLIIVDGRTEFAGIFGHPLADIYQTSEIAAVDIIRGPASVLYGTNALGGVINITTKKNQLDGFNFFTDINYGSFNTYKIKGNVAYKKKNFNNSFTFNKDYSNDNRPSSGAQSITAIYNAEYTFNSIWSLNFNSYINSSRVYNPGPVTNPYLNDSVWTDVTRANTSLKLKNKSSKYEGMLLMYFNNGVHDIYDGFHSNDNILGLSINESLELSKNSITSLGLEIKSYGGKARIKSELINKHVTEKALYLVFSQELFNKLSINAGIRLNHHSIYGAIIIPQFSLNYKLNKQNSVYGSIAEGFRSPTLNELYLFGANIDLKPEKLWNYEIGFKSEAFSGRLFINGAIFLAEGKDFIRMTGIYPNIKNQNISSLTNRGFELEVRYVASRYFSLNGNYSYIKSSTKLLGSPEQQSFIDVNYSYGVFSINANAKVVTNLFTSLKSNSSIERKQSYVLFSNSVWINAFKYLTFYLKLDNILNRKYEIIDGYPMPGRTYLFGINFMN